MASAATAGFVTLSQTIRYSGDESETARYTIEKTKQENYDQQVITREYEGLSKCLACDRGALDICMTWHSRPSQVFAQHRIYLMDAFIM